MRALSFLPEKLMRQINSLHLEELVCHAAFDVHFLPREHQQFPPSISLLEACVVLPVTIPPCLTVPSVLESI